MNKKSFMSGLEGIALFMYRIVCFGFVIMKTWNWLIAAQFEISVITYIQAVCIYWFIIIVFTKKTEAKRVLGDDSKEDNEWYYSNIITKPWIILLISYIIYLVI